MTDESKPREAAMTASPVPASPATVDLLVLGSGSAGAGIAKKAAKAGRSVVLVEPGQYGGTCALAGCNPKKVLVRAAELADLASRMRGQYLEKDADTQLDWKAVQAFRRSFVEPIPASTLESLHEAGVHTQVGQPRLTGPHECEVAGSRIAFERLVIATGAKPLPPPFEGADLTIDSDQFLRLPSLPASILFLGGGYISAEFAHVCLIAGCETAIVERGPRLLEHFDRDLVLRLEAHSRERGMKIYADSDVQGVRRRQSGGYDVTVATASGDRTLTADLVVQALGRVPNLDGLKLDAAGISSSEKGVSVDQQCRSTSQRHVWAVGDCADHGYPMLTPVANETSRCVSRQLDGESDAELDIEPLPTAAFTLPPIASVGLTEEEARERYGDDVRVRSEAMESWTTFRKVGAEVATYKTIQRESDRRLLGAHLLGPEAPELINLFALAMKLKATGRDLKSLLFAYPTLASEVRAMV